MTFVLNDVDLSKCIAFKGIKHVKEYVEGPNSGTSLAGTDILDIVSVKHTWTVKIMPLYAERARMALNSVRRGGMTLYTDYPSGESKQYNVWCDSVPVTMYAAPGGNEAYDGIVLTIRTLGDPDET